VLAGGILQHAASQAKCRVPWSARPGGGRQCPSATAFPGYAGLSAVDAVAGADSAHRRAAGADWPGLGIVGGPGRL